MESDAAARGKRRVQRKILDPVVQDILTEASKGKPKRRITKKSSPNMAMPAMQSRLAELSTYKDYFKTIM
jgi:activator of 2-hydroxyglutaryl-CoA dehydratase